VGKIRGEVPIPTCSSACGLVPLLEPCRSLATDGVFSFDAKDGMTCAASRKCGRILELRPIFSPTSFLAFSIREFSSRNPIGNGDRFEYRCTEKGIDFQKPMIVMMAWGDR
jgi:hypothetical protein